MSQTPQTPPPPPPSEGFGAPAGGQPWGQPGAGPGSGQESNGLAIAALVCGIVGLLLSWIPIVGFLGFLLGLVAVGTGIAGIRRARAPGVGQNGLAVGGLITGILAVLVSLIVFIGIVGVLNDPDVQGTLERLMEGDEDPREVIEDLERQLEEQN